jgi:NADP-dependent 3-hydroxy acid dehydrogenase YdfG
MVQPNELLTDCVAIVTGASSGIGRAIALALAKEGAQLCLAARRKAALEEVCAQACALGARAHLCCTDLTRDEDVGALAEFVRTNFGRADLLVLCGGAIFHGKFATSTVEQFEILYRSNLRGHYVLTQAVLPLLRERQGQIVFINSSAGLRSPAMAGQFSATQHAFRSIADSLRDEVNADGIRVLSVYPGRTATPRTAALFAEEGRPYHPELLLQPEDIAAMVTRVLTLPRTAEVTDIMIRPMRKSY